MLQKFEGGRLVVNVVEMPIKCPVAPLEFLFLADWYFTRKGIRNKVDLVYATPLPGAFTKPRAAAESWAACWSGKISTSKLSLPPAWLTPRRNVLSSYDEREIPYDLLVTIPAE